MIEDSVEEASVPALPPPPPIDELGGVRADVVFENDLNEEHKRIIEGRGHLAEQIKAQVASSIPIPRTHEQAMRSEYAEQWREAELAEFKQMEKMKVWKQVRLEDVPKGSKIMGCSQRYKVKPTADGLVSKFKYRFCADGRGQVLGVDFKESYAPVIEPTYYRWLVAIATQLDWDLIEFDFSGAFLNSDLPVLKRKRYMRPPPGLPLTHPNNVLDLLKGIYGNPDAARLWFDNVSGKWKELSWKQNPAEKCLFAKTYDSGKKLAIMILHVDDGGAGAKEIEVIEHDLRKMKQFYGLDSQPMQWHLGTRVTRKKGKWSAIQIDSYIMELAKRTGMLDCKKQLTPADHNVVLTKEYENKADKAKYMQMVGCLIYAATAARPDVAKAVATLAKFLRDPGRIHMNAAKRVIAYLLHSKQKGLVFKKEDLGEHDNEFDHIAAMLHHGYWDADFATCKDTRRSVSGILLFFGNGLIFWKCKGQSIVALSSFESETIAGSLITRAALAQRQVIKGILNNVKPTVLRGDNQPCLQSIRSGNYSSQRSKHIDLRFKHMTEVSNKEDCVYVKVDTKDNLADMLTKNQVPAIFKGMVDKLVFNPANMQ